MAGTPQTLMSCCQSCQKTPLGGDTDWLRLVANDLLGDHAEWPCPRGFEDNIYYHKAALALSNAQLVASRLRKYPARKAPLLT